MSLSTFISTNLQSADWRSNVNRTDLTKAIITPKMIHDISHDDADRARGILATLYHNDRPQLRRLCTEYCQQYSKDYDTLYAKWEQWVLTGRISSVAPANCDLYCSKCLEEVVVDDDLLKHCPRCDPDNEREGYHLLTRGARDAAVRDACKTSDAEAMANDEPVLANTPTEPPTDDGERYCPICLMAAANDDDWWECKHCDEDYGSHGYRLLGREARDNPLCGNCGQGHSIQQCPEIATALATPTLTSPVAPTPFVTSIEYDQASHRFIGRVNGNVCGEYETYLDANQDITAFADEISLSIAVGDVTPTAEDERISRLVHALAELQETAEQAEDYAAARAFVRAAYQVGKGIVVIGAGESWLVPSGTRPGTTHTVSQRGGAIICSCEAGINGAQCWHAALIEGQIKADQARG